MSRHQWLLTLGILIALGGLGLESATAPAAPGGGQNPSTPTTENGPVVIKTESNLVLVDVIATDKKGNYINDLEKKDFHVFEDNAEQPISSFSHETDIQPNAPGHQHYMVLFFDDSTMDAGLQGYARQQAVKFVESTASPNRLMAVVDFSGSLQIGQNFTADGELLKHAVSTVKFSAVNPNAGANVQLAAMGAPSLGRAQSDFGANTMLLSMRDVAKSLLGVPGRKTMILFSAGFPLTPERQSELTATIDALNKANIAVYPIDVRGLVASPNPGMDVTNPGARPGFPPTSEMRTPESPFPHLPGLWAALAAPPEPEPQHGGGGGGGIGGGGGGVSGGGGGKGGSSGSTGSTGSSGSKGSTGTGSSSSSSSSSSRGGGGSNPNATQFNNGNSLAGCLNSAGMMGASLNPNCPNRQIIPTIPDTVATNQQVLYALAKGTGGFEIFNTNDFLQGLQKVAKEMNEYYNLGYIPPSQTHDGSYHKIQVKMDRPGVILRYRTGYFDVKGPDLLQGKPEGKALEERAASPAASDVPVSLCAPYFYVEPGVARVNLALTIPGSAVDFGKQNGAFHSDVNVLGIAYRANGSVAARFSDTVRLDYQKKNEIKDFAKSSFGYQNTFNIAPGSYTLKVALSAGGQKFGKYEVPLVVDPFPGDTLSLGGPAFGDAFVPVSQLTANMDAALMEERTPLVVKNMELVPSTSSRFAKTSQPVVYVEVYDPALKVDHPPYVGVLYNIIDRKTNQQVFSSNTVLINDFLIPGNPLVPVGFRLPVDQLQAGDYRFEIKGRDQMGNVSPVRTADFSVQ
ncbi:MAG TPA: VWA domain-containing protein [Terriglobia bacterium]|nr:VWA domain-containing protein [Terriglobia bacterium]